MLFPSRGINDLYFFNVISGSLCFKHYIGSASSSPVFALACLISLSSSLSSVQMESPVSTPAPPPLHLLGSVPNSGDVSSPCEQIMVRTRSIAVNTVDAALATEPECLGPCEPGTSVNLEGIVWQETEDGEKSVITVDGCVVLFYVYLFEEQNERSSKARDRLNNPSEGRFSSVRHIRGTRTTPT